MPPPGMTGELMPGKIMTGPVIAALGVSMTGFFMTGVFMIWDFFTKGICPPPRVRGHFCAMELKSLHYRHVLYFWKPYDTRVSEMMFRR